MVHANGTFNIPMHVGHVLFVCLLVGSFLYCLVPQKRHHGTNIDTCFSFVVLTLADYVNVTII